MSYSEFFLSNLDRLGSFDEIIESPDERKPRQGLKLIEQILLLHLEEFSLKVFFIKSQDQG